VNRHTDVNERGARLLLTLSIAALSDLGGNAAHIEERDVAAVLEGGRLIDRELNAQTEVPVVVDGERVDEFLVVGMARLAGAKLQWRCARPLECAGEWKVFAKGPERGDDLFQSRRGAEVQREPETHLRHDIFSVFHHELMRRYRRRNCLLFAYGFVAPRRFGVSREYLFKFLLKRTIALGAIVRVPLPLDCRA
jgi:hypothetical protein